MNNRSNYLASQSATASTAHLHPLRLRASAGTPSRFRFSAFSSSAIRHPSFFLGRGAASTLDPRRSTGFTLIELLVVVAVIGILAGLALAAMGGIQKRSARAKAEAEVQALSAAIEEFHRDFGVYPGADSNALLRELLGSNAVINSVPGKIKVYFEPTPGIVGTNASGKTFFQDPWGTGYFFQTSGANMKNRGLFDIYSQAGGTDQADYIRN